MKIKDSDKYTMKIQTRTRGNSETYTVPIPKQIKNADKKYWLFTVEGDDAIWQEPNDGLGEEIIEKVEIMKKIQALFEELEK